MLSKFVVNGKLNMNQQVSKQLKTKLATKLPDSLNMTLADVKLSLGERPKLAVQRLEPK
jgi:hypothetical protein